MLLPTGFCMVIMAQLVPDEAVFHVHVGDSTCILQLFTELA